MSWLILRWIALPIITICGIGTTILADLIVWKISGKYLP